MTKDPARDLARSIEEIAHDLETELKSCSPQMGTMEGQEYTYAIGYRAILKALTEYGAACAAQEREENAVLCDAAFRTAYEQRKYEHGAMAGALAACIRSRAQAKAPGDGGEG